MVDVPTVTITPVAVSLKTRELSSRESVIWMHAFATAMPTTIFGSQFLSGIGKDLHELHNFTAICATQDIDLATHLIPAGEYSITINVMMGQVNIFVPKHVRTFVDGTVLFGITNFHDGASAWKKFIRNFRHGILRRTDTPIIAYADVSGEVRLRIHINGFLGAVRIYRLSQEAEILRPGIVAIGI